jgi:restriction system protein
MLSQYPYRTTTRNDYLGVSKVIRAMSSNELQWLVEVQQAKWAEQETRRKQQQRKEFERGQARQHVENLKLQTEEDTRAAQEQIALFRNVLIASLPFKPAVNWDSLLDYRTFPTFQFNLAKPDRDAIRLRLLGPAPTARYVARPIQEPPGSWESLLPFLRSRRLEREAVADEQYRKALERANAEHEGEMHLYRAREREVVAAYNEAAVAFNSAHQSEKAKYTRTRDEFLAHQQAHNTAVQDLKSRYEQGTIEAVEQHTLMILGQSAYPEGIAGEPEVRYDEPSHTLVVAFRLPNPAEVPRVIEHKFVASRKEIKPVEMKQKDFDAFYDDVLHQIGLRTVREVIAGDYAGHVQAVVFNGWVRGIDRKTGKEFNSCVLSFEADRQRFLDLDLAHVVPKECVRGLKGVTAGPLAQLAPVKPIMELNRDDDRFVESRPVLAGMSSGDNLAAMEWEDFEHLVRELFEKEFASSGGEVRVTQASRDQGVDAVAFDPDPIRGGKFVIQAKRYNMVVPVSAVRDLYGTMMNEGANRGILVTTSYFGRDSREFAKDKPITLIDGENLVFMFQKHGRDVQIELLPKGDPRRGGG